MFDATIWSRENLERHSMDMRQFVDFRQSTLPNGVRIVEGYNASGLNFTVLPDRGLDIWTAHYKGIPLTWMAQGAPFAPNAGDAWLRLFNGGLLVTCGLTHAGPPETDDETGEWRDLHGRYTHLRAQTVNVTHRGWHEGRYIVELTGSVAEQRLFGEQLRLTRTYAMTLDAPVIEIEDAVVNAGDLPMPFMILYHFNVGYPLVSAGARLHSANANTVPRDAPAVPGLNRWAEYDAATPRYAEQVFFHQVKAARDGMAEAALLHDDFGLSFQWDSANLPYLTQWKNVREGVYVCGVEPGNCLPEGRNRARRAGRLVTLQPGESRRFYCRLTVVDGKAAVDACKARIDALAQTGTPVANCNLDGFPI